jgi:hypothetical protein
MGEGSDQDWEVIKQIRKSFKGADDLMLGQILRNMVNSTTIDLNQLESANLNFLASCLKTGLEEFVQRDTNDTIGDTDSDFQVNSVTVLIFYLPLIFS